jgi:hypothetical protein
MPTIYKVLGQVETATTTNTDLYTVPSATTTVCSTLTASNKSSLTTNIRLAIRPLGASIEDKNYIIYDAFLTGNDSLFLTLGITLSATDVVTVYAGNADVSWSLFGSELT